MTLTLLALALDVGMASIPVTHDHKYAIGMLRVEAIAVIRLEGTPRFVTEIQPQAIPMRPVVRDHRVWTATVEEDLLDNIQSDTILVDLQPLHEAPHHGRGVHGDSYDCSGDAVVMPAAAPVHLRAGDRLILIGVVGELEGREVVRPVDYFVGLEQQVVVSGVEHACPAVVVSANMWESTGRACVYAGKNGRTRGAPRWSIALEVLRDRVARRQTVTDVVVKGVTKP